MSLDCSVNLVAISICYFNFDIVYILSTWVRARSWNDSDNITWLLFLYVMLTSILLFIY